MNGRPLNIENCVTDASPATSLACSNKFVQAGKVAVIPGMSTVAMPPCRH